MKTRVCLTMAATVAFLIAWPSPADAELPENYLRRWDNPAVQKRIDDGIEKNRKSDVMVTLLDARGKPISGAEVKIAQKSHGFLFGCNIFVLGQMKEKNRAYEDAFLKLFNFATVPFYWAGTEPEQGKLRLTEGSSYFWRRPPPDRAVAFGKKHGLTLKGHPLLWHAHNPDWIPKDPDELRRLYLKRFKELADRYAKDIPIWDGVNESLVCPPQYPFFSAENRDYPTYVPWAFTEEQKVFRPENTLILNDVTTFNWPPNETNRFYRQCAKLLENRIPIEGIGFQFHYFSRKALDGYLGGDHCDPGTLLDTYELFAKFGLPLWITEITIGSAGDDGLAVQGRVVRDIYRLWFAAPKMAGITWWNLGDGTAHGNEGVAGGGLADDDFKPKPAYQALDQLINHDWKTNLNTKSGAGGEVKFRGFHGRYRIEVTAGGQTKDFEVTVQPGEAAKATLTMP
ncbi:MAG: glycoside hydrolase family 10 [Rhodopirellula sp.]|nr:glycoside hydrolase family 10 [Rhodopirellula sp.]